MWFSSISKGAGLGIYIESFCSTRNKINKRDKLFYVCNFSSSPNGLNVCKGCWDVTTYNAGDMDIKVYHTMHVLLGTTEVPALTALRFISKGLDVIIYAILFDSLTDSNERVGEVRSPGRFIHRDFSIVAYGAAKMTADLQASSLCMVQLWASVGATAILYLTMSCDSWMML